MRGAAGHALLLVGLALRAAVGDPPAGAEILRSQLSGACGPEEIARIAERLAPDGDRAVQDALAVLETSTPPFDPILQGFDEELLLTCRARAARLLSLLTGLPPTLEMTPGNPLGTDEQAWRTVVGYFRPVTVGGQRQDPLDTLRDHFRQMGKHEHFRRWSLTSLAMLGDTSVREDLRALSTSPTPLDRQGVIRGLLALDERDEAFLRMLGESLVSPDARLALEAVRALETLGPDTALKIFRATRLSANAPPEVLAAVAASRLRLGDDSAIDALPPFLLHESEGARREAARGLARLSARDLHRRLSPLASGPPVPARVGIWGVQALRDIDRHARKRLVKISEEGQGASRRTALEWARLLDLQGLERLLDDSFEQRVNEAIDAGVVYLRGRCVTAGSATPVTENEMLDLLTLVKCGIPANDPSILPRIQCLAGQTPGDQGGTYGAGLALMLLYECGPDTYREAMERHARFLVDHQMENGMWGYARTTTAGTAGERGDNSNTQFAILGLRAAAEAGIEVPGEVWERTARHFEASQGTYGGWDYASPSPATAPYGSMTCSGICSILVCRAQLARGGPELNPFALPHVRKGLDWLAGEFSVSANPQKKGPSWLYYYLYSLERTGALTGQDRFGNHDWYQEGAEYLLDRQAENGSWGGPSGRYDTCFALLFLRRATRPLYAVGSASPAE